MLITMINMYNDQPMKLTYTQELHIIIYYNIIFPAMGFFVSSSIVGRSQISFFKCSSRNWWLETESVNKILFFVFIFHQTLS